MCHRFFFNLSLRQDEPYTEFTFFRGVLRKKKHWRKEGKKAENEGGSEDNSNVTVIVMHLK